MKIIFINENCPVYIECGDYNQQVVEINNIIYAHFKLCND